MFWNKKKDRGTFAERGYRTFEEKNGNHWHAAKNFRGYHSDISVF